MAINSVSDVDPPPPTVFRVDVSVDGTVARLAVFGEIDLSTVGTLEERVRATLDEFRPAHVIVDLRESTFMDSLGLRILLALQEAAKKGGFRLTVVRGPVAVQRVIEITSLHQLLEMVDDPSQALGGPERH
jgi:anti-anti-sigma factor